jgi:hypothetical protein
MEFIKVRQMDIMKACQKISQKPAKKEFIKACQNGVYKAHQNR